MKKIAIVLSIIFLQSCLLATPSPTGVSGLNKVISATPEHIGRFYFIWGGKVSQYRSTDSISLKSICKTPILTPTADTISYSAQKGNCAIWDIPFGLGYSINNYLEVNLNSAFLVDVMEDTVTTIADATGSGCVSYGFGDMELGVKFTPTQLPQIFSPELAKKFNIGIYPLFSFPTGAQKTAIPEMCGQDTILGYPCRKSDGGIHRSYTNGGVAYGGKLLLSGILFTKSILIAHLNLGYMHYPYGDNKYTYGLGVEYQYQFFSPFIELYGEHRILPTDQQAYDDGGTFITPGLRFKVKNSWIAFAVDFKILGNDKSSWNFANNLPEGDFNTRYELNGFGATPPWKLNLILSHGFDFVKTSPSEEKEQEKKIIEKPIVVTEEKKEENKIPKETTNLPQNETEKPTVVNEKKEENVSKIEIPSSSRNKIGIKTFIPGMVQLSNKEAIKGWSIIGGETITLIGGVVGWYWNTTEYDKYTTLPIGTSQDEFDKHLNNSEFYGNMSIASFTGFGALYLYSVIDAIWLSHTKESIPDKKQGFYLIPEKDGMGLSAMIKF
ncbi:MAG: hypothetical protein PHE49_07330 [bacterium]|nr:hypothetical protein [bacterium]